MKECVLRHHGSRASLPVLRRGVFSLRGAWQIQVWLSRRELLFSSLDFEITRIAFSAPCYRHNPTLSS